MGSQRVGHDWATELNWISVIRGRILFMCSFFLLGWSWSVQSREHWGPISFAGSSFSTYVKCQILQALDCPSHSMFSLLEIWPKSFQQLHIYKQVTCIFISLGYIPPSKVRNQLPTWTPHRSDQIRSVSQSCLTLCDPMNHSTPGIPVHHQLPEFTHVHRVGDAIQPSHPLSSPSPTPNTSQHQGLFQWVNSSHEVAKVLEFQL